jgi:hypothetical protein
VKRPIPPAFGPYVHPGEADFEQATSFKRTEPLVGTYYFYWYEIHTQAHIVDGDGTDALTTHPPTLEDFSYKSVRWHRRQLEDRMAAGIDFLLPVFWGAPSEQDPEARLHWSYEGLPPLVEAREELVREGRSPPRIGLFYDTSTLQWNSWHYHADLTTDYGREWFYATVRDFFSMIPPRHWAMIDGRPIVLLYSAGFALKHDQSVIDVTQRRFARDFAGRRPWIAREVSWNVEADGTVAWGGALGLQTPGIASLGPGYDHSAVPGRTPLIVDRRSGKFYEENWTCFLRRPSNIVMLETWNEFHEGTDIAESKEYSRQYIDLTRHYVDLFKRGVVPPWPAGPYRGAEQISVQLGPEDREEGLRRIEAADGATEATTIDGRTARFIQPKPGLGRYVYFSVDDSFKVDGAADYLLTVHYLDAAPGELGVEFDGSDAAAPFNGAYSSAATRASLNGDRTWKTAEFTLHDACLVHRQNQGADFRLVIEGAAEFAVAEVVLRRPAEP